MKQQYCKRRKEYVRNIFFRMDCFQALFLQGYKYARLGKNFLLYSLSHNKVLTHCPNFSQRPCYKNSSLLYYKLFIYSKYYHPLPICYRMYFVSQPGFDAFTTNFELVILCFVAATLVSCVPAVTL